MADQELYSFMTKLLDLRRAGNNARLTVECQNGKTFINLQLHLNNPPGPAYPRQRPRPSPSRLRRRARREQARTTAAAIAAVHDTAVQVDLPKLYPAVDVAVQAVLPPPLPTVDTAVQVVVPALLTVEEVIQVESPEVLFPFPTTTKNSVGSA